MTFNEQPKIISSGYKSYILRLSDFMFDACEHNFEYPNQLLQFMLSIKHHDTKIVNNCVRIQGVHKNGMLITNGTFKLKEK